MAKKKSAPDDDASSGEMVQARVLVDCWLGAVDELVELDPGIAEAAARDGYVDTHPNALAGAKKRS